MEFGYRLVVAGMTSFVALITPGSTDRQRSKALESPG
jgi:hypothetical protein